MAKKPTAEADPPAPTVETRVVKQIGKFSFTITKGHALPAFEIGRPPRTDGLPFKDIFRDMAVNEEFFLPTSFWTSSKSAGGRAVPSDKATGPYIRAKVRDAFNDLKKAEPERFESRYIQFFERKAGDDGGRFEEPGFSVFMLDRGPVTPDTPPAEADVTAGRQHA